jgi:hypothetical protein
MPDHAIQSAINTIRNWYVRGLAKGRIATREQVKTRILTLWPDLPDADVEAIITGVMACATG